MEKMKVRSSTSTREAKGKAKVGKASTSTKEAKGKAKVGEISTLTDKKTECNIAKSKSVNTAREKLFHVKMQIKKTIVTTIFDSGSQKNLISEALVQ